MNENKKGVRERETWERRRGKRLGMVGSPWDVSKKGKTNLNSRFFFQPHPLRPIIYMPLCSLFFLYYYIYMVPLFIVTNNYSAFVFRHSITSGIFILSLSASIGFLLSFDSTIGFICFSFFIFEIHQPFLFVPCDSLLLGFDSWMPFLELPSLFWFSFFSGDFPFKK